MRVCLLSIILYKDFFPLIIYIIIIFKYDEHNNFLY